MVQRKGGFRRGTRYKFQKERRDKGKVSFRRFLQSFNVGDKVKMLAEPAYQKGMYYPRFHGKIGEIKGAQGECYKVMIHDHAQEKLIIVHPVHLRKI